MAKRIYLVSDVTGTDDDAIVNPHLVNATSAAKAISHISKPRFAAKVASQQDLVQYLAKHVVEEAGDATEQ